MQRAITPDLGLMCARFWNNESGKVAGKELSNVLMGMTFGAVNIFSGSKEATEDTDTIASFIDGCNEAMRKQGHPLSQEQSEVLYGILAGITSKQRGSDLQDILAALGAKDAERLRHLLNLPQIPA